MSERRVERKRNRILVAAVEPRGCQTLVYCMMRDVVGVIDTSLRAMFVPRQPFFFNGHDDVAVNCQRCRGLVVRTVDSPK